MRQVTCIGCKYLTPAEQVNGDGLCPFCVFKKEANLIISTDKGAYLDNFSSNKPDYYEEDELDPIVNRYETVDLDKIAAGDLVLTNENEEFVIAVRKGNLWISHDGKKYQIKDIIYKVVDDKYHNPSKG